MSTKLSFLVVGVVLGIGVTLALGAVAGRFETGRYAVSAWDNRVFIIDTATGELWERSMRLITPLGTVTEPLIGRPTKAVRIQRPPLTAEEKAKEKADTESLRKAVGEFFQ